MKFSSLAALEAVKMTSSSAARDKNFVKMTIFSFRCEGLYCLPMGWTSTQRIGGGHGWQHTLQQLYHPLTTHKAWLVAMEWSIRSAWGLLCSGTRTCHSAKALTHLLLDKMTTVSQTIFSDAFPWMKSIVFWLKFSWSLSTRVQLIKIQHWFR